jgi:hypothetical protein
LAFQPTLSKFGVPLVLGQSGIGILQPKLKYRFQVTMQNFGPAGGAVNLTRQVATCAKPQLQTESTPIHSYNNIMYVAGKPTWQTLQMTVRDDITNSVSTLVAAQLQKQMNHFDQTSAVAGINYKFTTTITTLDGGNVNALENWYLEGCFLQSAEYDSYDYSSSDQMMISLTIQFDNATQDSSIMPLSQPATGTGSLAG